MSVLLFAEHSEGNFKKAVLEAATYAADLAEKMGDPLEAVAVGPVDAAELARLGKYGVKTVYHIQSDEADSFVNTAYAAAISEVAKAQDVKVVVFAQTYDGRAVSPRVAAKLKAAPLSGVSTLLDPADNFNASRLAYSGKGVQDFSVADDSPIVVTVKTNSYGVKERDGEATVAQFDSQIGNMDFNAVAKEVVKASEGISLTEAENVVSAGRGMKGPENWGMIEELAAALNAATACSKPVSDMDWRPHHEHVGQTGIQIAPNLYIAIGISGAIQHLAGVSSSKNIVVINKDPEAPFFKIADYGIVGDLFEVVPMLIEAVKSAKAAA